MNDFALCLVVSTIASHSLLNIPETVRDRGLVPKDHQQEMTYGVSNDYMINWWPRLERNISKTAAGDAS